MVNQPNRVKESKIDMNLEWTIGCRPSELSPHEKMQVIDLFEKQTGEQYTIHSLNSLNIPEWYGNLLLRDSITKTIKGVFWSHPVGHESVRIAAFVLSDETQNQGIGTSIWSHCVNLFLEQGYQTLRLEVRSDNERALSFYQHRGLIISETLTGYYAAGPGYLMTGRLPSMLNVSTE